MVRAKSPLRRTRSRAIARNRNCSASSARTALGATPASIGKRRKMDWQKECTVSTRGPLSLSSVWANNRRARAIISWLGVTIPIEPKSAVNSAVGIIAQLARRTAILFRISAAAARVYVTHKIPSASAPASNSRKTRSVKSLVLPVPALAETNTEASGSDARSCAALAAITGLFISG